MSTTRLVSLALAAAFSLPAPTLAAEIASVEATPVSLGRSKVTVTINTQGKPMDYGSTWGVSHRRLGYGCSGMFAKGITTKVGPNLYRTSRTCYGIPSRAKALQADVTFYGRTTRKGRNKLRLQR